ncbi:MAG: hypothetical protein OTJ98_10480 [Dehalococcoidia bacterium]|nr:hypothetical protein [Dehalococcoidia bacterium]
MRQFRIVTAVCAFGFAIAQVNAEEQFLVDEGKANAEIIISESPARSTRLASVELQTYVAKITDQRRPTFNSKDARTILGNLLLTMLDSTRTRQRLLRRSTTRSPEIDPGPIVNRD